MDNETLNSTQPASETSNPQNAVPADGASKAEDFQTTAPYDALNQQSEELTVQQTGEPLPLTDDISGSSNTPLIWIAIIVVFIAAVWLVAKLIRESVEDDKVSEPVSKPATASARRKTTKKTTKKKPAAAQRRKKSAKKRR